MSPGWRWTALRAAAAAGLAEQPLGALAANHSVGDPIGVALVAVAIGAEASRERDALALLHDVRGLVSGDAQRRRLAKDDVATAGIRGRADRRRRLAGLGPGVGAYVAEIVAAKRVLNGFQKRQRGATAPSAGLGRFVIVAAGGDGKPQLIRHTAADKITALTASQALTAALYARDVKGAGGQHLEVSMLESVVQFVWADAAGNEIWLDADGSQPSSFSRDQKLWKTKDGFIIAAPTSDKDIRGICEGLGVDGWDHPDVATILARRANPEKFQALLRRVLAKCETLTSAEALAGMEQEGAPCGAVLTPAELAEDPQVKALGMLDESTHPAGGPLRQPRPAARFGTTPATTGAHAPTLGQHTDEILRELGRGDRVDALRADGVVA